MNNNITKLKNGDFKVGVKQKGEKMNKEKQIDKILEVFKTDDQQSGCYINTCWRITGFELDEENNGYDIKGFLHLANSKYFDRWANSGSLAVDLGLIEWEIEEQRELRDVISKALEFYN